MSIGEDQLMLYSLEKKYGKYGVKVSIHRLGKTTIFVPLIIKNKDDEVIYKAADLKNEIWNTCIVYLTNIHAVFKVTDPIIIDGEE